MRGAESLVWALKIWAVTAGIDDSRDAVVQRQLHLEAVTGRWRRRPEKLRLLSGSD